MKLDFEKGGGLLPVVVQNATNRQVLMVGYMNEAALAQSLESGWVTFYSRSKQRLWVKGETSGNRLKLVEIHEDCDHDSILVLAHPSGPTCHTGATSCFGKETAKGFLYTLEQTIHNRIDQDVQGSYTNELFRSGMNKVAQKVGEEAVELVIEAMCNNEKLFLNESADLLYHFLILLKAKNVTLSDVEAELKRRTFSMTNDE